jgi:hypothetical protein
MKHDTAFASKLSPSRCVEHPRSQPRAHHGERGVALIVVISALVMLLVLAVPFVLTGKKDFKIASAAASQMRARQLADAAVEMAAYRLGATHRGIETAGLGAKTPYWDTLDELTVDPHPEEFSALLPRQDDRLRAYMGDPRGDLWSVRVTDEQSKINLDTAPPFLIGALLGRTVLTEDFAPNGDYLAVESTDALAPEGGSILIGSEVTTYKEAKSGKILGVKLQGEYKKDAWVLAKSALDVALFEQRAQRGGQSGAAAPTGAVPYAGFGTLAGIKDVGRYGGQAIAEEKLDFLLAPFTVHGQRPSPDGWLGAQRIIAELNPADYDAKRGQPVRVRNPDYFNPGTTVKITDGQAAEYGVVVRSVRRGEEGAVFLLEPVKRIYAYDTATIAAEMRHPVNVNGCSREVLVMLLNGLEMSQGGRAKQDAANRVTPELAGEVADMIIKNRPLHGIEHFAEMVKTLYHAKRGATTSYPGAVGREALPNPATTAPDMNLGMATAIVQNAVNPCFRGLVTSTMPFTFTSGDVFTVDAESSVNDAAGTELGHRRVRQTFRTAPARPLAFRLDSQVDFEDSIIAGRRGRFIETHPNPQSWFTGFNAKPETRLFRWFSNFENAEKRGFFADAAEGDVRLQPARLVGARQGVYEEHFDGDAGMTGARESRKASRSKILSEDITPEGYILRGAAFELPLASSAGGGSKSNPGASNPASGTVADDHGLLPFALDFYTKPQSFGAAPVLFSMTGDDPSQDYVRCWYEPQDRAIHLKVHDITLDAPGGGIEEAAETVWTPQAAQLEDDTWYHVGAHLRGTKPEDVSLHIDGFKRGESRFKSPLRSSMTDRSTTFEVEDAEGWPDYGPVWIGAEVVMAERLSGNSFRVFDFPGTASGGVPFGRGSRGTGGFRLGHSPGETVQVFGYSSSIVSPLLTSGLAQASNSASVIMEGGGRLMSTLAPVGVCSIVETGVESYQFGPVTVTVGVYDPNAQQNITLEPYPGRAPEHETFQTSGGYALIVSLTQQRPTTAGGTPAGGVNAPASVAVELVRYGGRQNNVLTGVVGVPNPPNELLSGSPTLTVPNLQALGGGAVTVRLTTSSTRVKHDVRNAAGGPNGARYSAIFPISVHLSKAASYREPDVSIASAGAGGDTEPEYVQLGQPERNPTYKNAGTHRVEWIRYHHLDLQAQMLLCDAKDRIEAAVREVVQSFTGGGLLPSATLINSGLDFRNQLGTDRFGYSTLGAARDDHTTNEEIIPVFRTDPIPSNFSQSYSSPAGYADNVTVISDVDRLKERHYVAWASQEFVAFCDNVTKRVHQRGLPIGPADRRLFTRLCKFPSGELPLITTRGQAWIGGDTSGRVTSGGLIDEVRLRGLAPERYVLWDQTVMNPPGAGTPPNPLPLGIDANATDIPITLAQWDPHIALLNLNSRSWLADGRTLDFQAQPTALPPDAGCVLIDDEIVCYRQVGAGRGGFALKDCERGFMNTTPVPHSMGANIVFLDWRPVTTLASQADANDWDIQVASEIDFAPQGGTVLVGQEMMHYVRALNGVLSMPKRIPRDGANEAGLFRGRYGTRIGAHQTADIVLDMPFRYWDRYAEASDDPELAMYELAINQPGGFFGDLRWTHQFAKPQIGIKILCRLDPRTPWDLPPGLSHGTLRMFESKSGQTQKQVNTASLRVNGEGLEARAFFVFEPNAFDPVDLRANGWKETPRLEQIEVGYVASPQVLVRETLP